MAHLRITGLVRLADRLRHELAHPMSRDQRDRLRTLVSSTLNDVRRILGEHRASIQHLPAPSQRACHFLGGIDWDKVAIAESGHPTPQTPARTSYAGLGTFVERALHQLAGASGEAQVNQLHASIATMSRRIEFDIERAGLRADQLSPTTRSLRGWLAFLAERENVAAYIAAIAAAAPLVAPAVRTLGYRQPVVLHFRPMSHLYRIRQQRSQTTVALSTPMIAFGPAEFAILVDAIATRSRHAKQRLHETMMGEGYQTLHAELESLSGLVEHLRGAYHDLATAFDRVNTRYFAGQMPRPRLTWSQAFTGRKFGHYDRLRDTVMVSSTLDQRAVPQFVVDFIVYHELLHKHLGWRIVDGRRYSHTSQFRDLERRFDRYTEAEAVIQRLASNLPPSSSSLT